MIKTKESYLTCMLEVGQKILGLNQIIIVGKDKIRAKESIILIKASKKDADLLLSLPKMTFMNISQI